MKIATRLFIFITAPLAFALAAPLSPSPLWGGLKPGPYAVGFDVHYRYDFSQSWRPKHDATGRQVEGIRARRMRLSVWYPAVDADAVRMLYRDYVFVKQADPRFTELDAFLQKRNVDSLERAFSREALQQLLSVPTAAAPRAMREKGPFPLVLYASGLNESWQHVNNVMAEYLASHGYVVVSVPQLGTRSDELSLRIDPIDLETQVRDLQYAAGVAHEFANVDANKLGLIGHSMGAVAVLILHMRYGDADAVAGLDGSYGLGPLAATLTGSHWYQPSRFRVPLLDIRRGHENLDLKPIDALARSDCYYLRFPGLTHADFTSFAMIANRFPSKVPGHNDENAAQACEIVCRYILAFLVVDQTSAQQLIKGIAQAGQMAMQIPARSVAEARLFN